MSARPRSLRHRLALWVSLSTTITLLVFGVIAYALVVAESRERPDDASLSGEPEDAREEVLVAMLIAAPFCLAVSVGGAFWLSRRALAPLDAVIRETRAIGSEDLRRRLPALERDDELHQLTDALNGLLSRLDEGHQALSNYAASASHELRTPLAVITTELEVALRRPRAPAEWERIAKTSLDELARLTRLVEALLTLSRDSATPMELGPVEVAASIERALLACADEAQGAGIGLTRATPRVDLEARGNAELLGKALEELVRNAIRYTPREGAVRVRCEALDDGRVAVHVDDTGAGVAEAERASIFLPFIRGAQARGEGERGRDVRGSGLGLSIAKRIVERCGGELRVGSSPEGGARFSMILEARVRP